MVCRKAYRENKDFTVSFDPGLVRNVRVIIGTMM